MRVLVILATVIGVSLARPDVSHLQGYHYEQQGGGHSSGGHHSSGGGHSSGGNNVGFEESSYSRSGSSGGGGDDQVHRGETQVIDLSDSFGGSSSSGSSSSGASFGGGATETEITKSFYIHEAPEEESRSDFQQQAVKNKKHYKIIFVKAPSEGGAAGGQQAFPQHEEKTIVYVLSKKNGGADGGFAEAPAPVTSKPDVFFIKYRNQEDSDTVVSKIQESFKEGGEGYNSPDAFARSLGAQSGSGRSSSSSSSGGSSQQRQQSFGSSSSGFSAGSSAGFSSGGGSQRVSSGFSSNFIQPQQMIEIPSHESVFQSNYLPPNRRI